MQRLYRFITFSLLACLTFVGLVACNNDTTTAAVTTTNTSSQTTASGILTTTSTAEPTTANTSPYFLAGNFSGYVANDDDFRMTAIPDRDGWYQITVTLNADNRDNAYDGHYYKVTDGTWTTCYGVDNYALQPAPVSPTGGGLGSIWVYDNMDLTVLFDANTLTIYDNSMERDLANPVVYGDFSNWSLTDQNALVLTESEEDENLFIGSLTLPAYEGTDENGYSLAVCLSEKYYVWQGTGSWGANEQYLFDGSAAAMGLVSHLKPEVETTYDLVYNATTHVTTVTQTLASPMIYGDFSNWSLTDDAAVVLTESDDDANLFVGSLTLPAYSGTDELGYSLAVCLTSQLYFWEGVGSWGAGEQYLFDGSAGGMGLVSRLKPEEETTYDFVYDATTHVTTVTVTLTDPVVYGDFSNWSLDPTNAIELNQDAQNDNLYIGSFTMPAYTGTGEGYMLAVCLTKQLYFWEGVGSWGAGQQYLFSGDAGGMGKVTYLDLDESMLLIFTYDATTNQTTITPPTGKAVAPYEKLAGPTLYGTFTRVDNDNQCFLLEGAGAAIMTKVAGEADLYEITLTLPVFTAPTSGYYTEDAGYRFLTVLTKANVGWGYYAGEQYLFDGSLAGMGGATIINITEAGQYRFVYNATTHITTYTKVA